MELYDSIEHPGTSLALVGDTGVGKTTSILQSAPDPIFFANIEPRDPRLNLKPANREGVRVQFARYTNWESMFAFFANRDNLKEYNSIVTDSLTHLANVELSQELEELVYETSSSKGKTGKKLIAETKLSEEAWGALSSQLNRLIKLIHSYVHEGKIVIWTARVIEQPRYNTDLQAAPAFKGKQFPLNFPGFCDLIGLVETRYRTVERSGKKSVEPVYPPLVSFGRKGAMTKWTGQWPEKGINNIPLNIERIVRVAGWVPMNERKGVE